MALSQQCRCSVPSSTPLEFPFAVKSEIDDLIRERPEKKERRRRGGQDGGGDSSSWGLAFLGSIQRACEVSGVSRKYTQSKQIYFDKDVEIQYSENFIVSQMSGQFSQILNLSRMYHDDVKVSSDRFYMQDSVHQIRSP